MQRRRARVLLRLTQTDHELIGLAAQRRIEHHFGVIVSSMRQHVGRFDGWVKAGADAPRRPVEGLAGLAEDYRARW